MDTLCNLILIQRLYRRYKKLSKQKKYLVLLIAVLFFILTMLLVILMILLVINCKYRKPIQHYTFIVLRLIKFLLKVSKFRYIYLKSVDGNETSAHSQLTTTNTMSTTIVTTTTPKKLGLVGDTCLKVMGDCEQFMECRKHDGMLVQMNVSTCNCLSGYKANEKRYCS